MVKPGCCWPGFLFANVKYYIVLCSMENKIPRIAVTFGRLVILSEIIITFAITKNTSYCMYLIAGYLAYKFNK